MSDVVRSDQPQGSAKVAIDEPMRKLMADARELLDYAVSGAFAENPAPLPQDVIDTIVACAYTQAPDGAASTFAEVSIADWSRFLRALAKLGAYTAPVTAATLRATRADSGERNEQTAIARKVTRSLWAATAIFILVAITTEYFDLRVGPAIEGQVDGEDRLFQLLSVIQPFVYGGLGACAYLLRSAHAYIAKRAFDVNYVAEYYNRILLGMVSGGGVVLLAGQYIGDDGATIKIGQAALGFIAGYSTDFLFKSIERIMEALFPKIGLESIRKERERRGVADAARESAEVDKILDAIAKSTDDATRKALLDRLARR